VDPTCAAPQVHQFKPVIWDSEGIHELPTVAGDQRGVALAIDANGAAAGASADYAESLTRIIWLIFSPSMPCCGKRVQ
jgi:hypothetical protein